MRGGASVTRAPIVQRLRTLDLSLLRYIESETTAGDKRSLLALHRACRERFGSFTYLEIGSHLGGSLQSFIADPGCTAIVSIDPRPLSQPDERWSEPYRYPGNSTQRMLDLLARVPDAQLEKLETLEARTEDLTPGDIPAAPHLCFIDGEHTVAAARRDADFCLEVVRRPGAIAFHDRAVIGPAIRRSLRRSDGFGYPLPDNIFVVEVGGHPFFGASHVRALVPRARLWALANAAGTARWWAPYDSPWTAIRDRIRLRTRLRRLLG